MHSERFMRHTMLPAMLAEVVGDRTMEQRVNKDVCFLRVRADRVVITWDCWSKDVEGAPGSRTGPKKAKAMVESIVGRTCKEEGRAARCE